MAAPKGKEMIDKLFEEILIDISEKGYSLIKSLKDRMSTSTFYDLIENDVEKSKRYARATQDRADRLADEIIDISEHTEEDHTPFTGSNVIQRDRLRIDARKWLLAKLHPKKYGDKIDVTSDGEKIQQVIKIGYGDTDKD